MRKLYKIIYLIYICFAIAGSTYEEVFQAKNVIGTGKNYQNPEWSSDSKFFTVEMHMGSSQTKTFKLYLGEIDEQINFSPLIADPFKKKKSQIGKSKKIRERNLGWLKVDDGYRFYGTIDKSHKIRDCYIEDDIFEIYPVTEFEDLNLPKLSDLELNFPLREYTISNNNIYFTTYSEPKRIWLLTGDPFTYSILGYLNQESKKMIFDIPLVSLSASLNDNKILLVCYNENQSEIIMLNKGNDYDESAEIKIYNKTDIKKPVSEKMNYLYGILDPNNHNRYLLIARKQSDAQSNINNDSKGNTERRNLADVFVMNGKDLEGKFIMYRSFEDNLLYNNPEVQFHPDTGHIYFIDDINGNKNLSYWNGEKVVSTSLKLDNIMNFKFSPDGNYLLATTFVPEDLYVYEVFYE